MRTRTLQYETISVPSYGWSDNVVIRSRELTDVNNRRTRPHSPCIDKSYRRAFVPLRLPDGSQTYLRINPTWVDQVYGFTKGQRFDHDNFFAKQMTKAVNESLKKWSSLNFLYELREVGDLIKKIMVEPENLRPIDWMFGMAPTLMDIKAALKQYDSVVQRTRPQLEELKSIPFHKVRRASFDADSEIALAAGMPFYHQTNGVLISKASGSIDMSLPWLAMVSPDLYKVLDSLAIDPSAGNAYEAFPWSWFADWFLPVGDYLGSLPSLMYPLTQFNGIISHKVIGVTDTFHKDWSLNYQPIPGPGGQVASRYYERRVVNDSVSSLIKWQVKGLSSPSQVVLLRDILFPTKSKT